MRAHAAAPVASKDYVKLAQTFETIAKQNPDPAKWGNWTKIANDGALAAREGRESGVRASCGRCHRAYRRAYNARYRELAVAP
jgi:cytochrome c553